MRVFFESNFFVGATSKTGVAWMLSASQISRFAPQHGGCERKHALKYVADLPEPTGPALELGKDVDDNQLQPYLTKGQPFNYTRPSGYIAASALGYLPQPMTHGLEVQKRFELPAPGGRPYSYLGFKDLWMPNGGMPDPPEGVDPKICTVVDFKTTKDLKWAKTAEQLAVDPQAQLYATNAFFEMARQGSVKGKQVHLVWLYMQTQGAKKVRRTWLTVDADHVFRQFTAIDAIGQKIVAMREAAPPPNAPQAERQAYALSLPPNTESCNAFGGCPYRHVCNLSPSEFIDSLVPLTKKENTVPSTLDLFASLQKKQEMPAAAPVSLMGMSDKDVPAPPADVIPPAFAAPAPPPVVGINPPEQSLPPAPPVGTVEAKPKRGRPKKEKAVEAPSDAVVVAQIHAEAAKAVAAIQAGAAIPAGATQVFPVAQVTAPAPSAVDDAINELVGSAIALGTAIRKVASALQSSTENA